MILSSVLLLPLKLNLFGFLLSKFIDGISFLVIFKEGVFHDLILRDFIGKSIGHESFIFEFFLDLFGSNDVLVDPLLSLMQIGFKKDFTFV